MGSLRLVWWLGREWFVPSGLLFCAIGGSRHTVIRFLLSISTLSPLWCSLVQTPSLCVWGSRTLKLALFPKLTSSLRSEPRSAPGSGAPCQFSLFRKCLSILPVEAVVGLLTGLSVGLRLLLGLSVIFVLVSLWYLRVGWRGACVPPSLSVSIHLPQQLSLSLILLSRFAHMALPGSPVFVLL